MKRAAVLLLPVLVLLAGCAAGPSRDEVLERFSIEIRGAGDDLPASMVESQASMLTDAALEGECGSDEYRDSMIAPSLYLLVPWDATCFMYFEDEMTAAQVERAKQTIATAALDR